LNFTQTQSVQQTCGSIQQRPQARTYYRVLGAAVVRLAGDVGSLLDPKMLSPVNIPTVQHCGLPSSSMPVLNFQSKRLSPGMSREWP
jgi:hypothetical protein